MKRGKIMAWVLGVVVLLIAGILIWFIVPYSPTKAEFARLTRIHQMLETQSQNGIFTNEDIAELPSDCRSTFNTADILVHSKCQTCTSILMMLILS